MQRCGEIHGAESDLIAPTIEMALGRFEAEWPRVWMTYGLDADLGWRDPEVSSLFCGVQLPSACHYRQYRVRARVLGTAIKRLAEMVRCPWPVVVTVYRFTPPPKLALTAHLEQYNARLERQRHLKTKAIA